MNRLLDNVSRENKIILLLGDFNIDLLKYDGYTPTKYDGYTPTKCDGYTPAKDFFDSLPYNMILLYILHLYILYLRLFLIIYIF